MGEVVNLRARRKAKARADKERQAEENRIRFGRSLAERKLAEKVNEFENKKLDFHRLPQRPSPRNDADQ